ncbi:MEDS domain-containing protein [Bacillus sp. Marseille-Q1617]|uniref:MEDS domain-containing protein n=1 Tax=Bacillus sp. Marseille-Q1617 TaxID=2736887 RepID=UPI00158B5AFC|nr:MEDS domain-containing protein [Bacillus sp. Marseille-Q1617]
MKDQILNLNTCAHVLYSYENGESYIKNVIVYISEGIKSGDSVILIENERNIKIIFKQLKSRLTDDQLEKVHAISNFEFYLTRGSYHPPAVYEQLTKTITPYIENGIPFRSWANVEWGSLDDPSQIIDWFEKETDRAVLQYKLKVVCAYGKEKMPAEMQSILEKSHPHIMTDDNLMKSNTYDPSHMLVKKGD